jgi:polyisoprenoid-binding protein YceI
MERTSRFVAMGIVFAALGLELGCGKKEAPVDLAPVSSASLEAPKATAAAGAVTLSVDAPSSSVKFLMDSPLEKIDGDAPGSASGELSLDLEDLSKSSGLVKVDLDKLSLYQQRRKDENGEYGERKKNPLQNQHARDWFQIEAHEGEVTAEQAQKNRIAELRIDKLEPSVKSVLALSGPERKVTATASGTLRLHGRQAPKSLKVELTFRFAGDKLEALSVKTLEPLVVELEKFEIHPRDSAGKLVKSITETIATSLKGKVKNEAPVEVEFTAKPR